MFAVQRWSMSGLQDAEYLFHVLAPVARGSSVLPADESERLINLAATHGRDWLTAQSEIDTELAYNVANEVCVAAADSAYERRKRELQDRNDDRATAQMATLESHYRREQDNLLTRFRREVKRPELSRMTEGKIRVSTERFERGTREIEKRRRLTHSSEEICVGVLKIVD